MSEVSVPVMEKAYDLKNLGLRAKARGLVVAEDAAEEMLEVVLGWFQDSAQLSPNAIDDMFVAGIPYIRKLALAQIDKIDGSPKV